MDREVEVLGVKLEEAEEAYERLRYRYFQLSDENSRLRAKIEALNGVKRRNRMADWDRTGELWNI